MTRKEVIDTLEIAKAEVEWNYPYCSICKNEPQGRIMTDYCPSCGVYMKGESNER